MTAHELVEWMAFERLFGPITIQERTDTAGTFVRVDPEPVAPQDPDDMVAFMRGIQRRGEK